MSYTIYARPRPVRTALVLDKTVFREGTWHCDALLDGIVASAIGTWGGRQNAIVLIEPDSDLSVDEWGELEAADPDRVQAFAPLKDAWVQRFHTRLLPWKIAVKDAMREAEPKGESFEARWRWLDTSLPGLATPPFPENFKKLPQAPLLMIEFSQDCPLEIRRFFHRNFGTFYQWLDRGGTVVRRIAWLEHTLPSVDVETIHISDMPSACAAINAFAGSLFPPKPRRALPFVAPTQLSSIDLDSRFPRGPYQHAYRVFVGDSLHDFTACWNELRRCGCWAVPYRYALWVPAVLTRESTFMDALRGFLYEYSGKHSSGSRSIEITSDTISSGELEALCSTLRTGKTSIAARALDGATRRARLREQLRDELEVSRPHAFLNSTNAERIRAWERVETLPLSEPDVLVGDGEWAVDVQVEIGAGNRFQSPRWWCLPRRSGSALAERIFGSSARVTRSHLFAVEIERRMAYPGYQKIPELHIALPKESDVVTSLILGGFTFSQDDVRKNQLREEKRLSKVRISNPGQNLRGLIEAFGSFWTAEEFCQRRFWREALEKLAGQDAQRCRTLFERIRNAVRKSLAGKEQVVEETSERIVESILPHVKGALEDEPLRYAALKELLDDVSGKQPPQQNVSYLAGDIIVHQHGVAPLSEDEMKRGLNDLLARNVLRAGVVVHCRHCGIESWLHIDEVQQFNECAGCGNLRPLAVDTEWLYRLNSLAKRCVSAHILAVLQALSSIAHNSTVCFFYSPSLNLYQPGSEDIWREVDVACVSDGKLIIGEVKDGSFDKRELDRFADTAEVIQPDRAAVFVPQHRFDAKVEQWFSELKSRLATTGVRAEAHQLPAL
jgi:hypothetical protein